MSFSGGGLGGALTSVSDNASPPVRVYDFSKWLAATVALDDVVVCKIDAEGAEFDILRCIMTDGTLCLCDRLSIEWHGWIGNNDKRRARGVELRAEPAGHCTAPGRGQNAGPWCQHQFFGLAAAARGVRTISVEPAQGAVVRANAVQNGFAPPFTLHEVAHVAERGTPPQRLRMPWGNTVWAVLQPRGAMAAGTTQNWTSLFTDAMVHACLTLTLR